MIAPALFPASPECGLSMAIAPELGSGPSEDTSLSHSSRHGNRNHAPAAQASHWSELSRL